MKPLTTLLEMIFFLCESQKCMPQDLRNLLITTGQCWSFLLCQENIELAKAPEAIYTVIASFFQLAQKAVPSWAEEANDSQEANVTTYIISQNGYERRNHHHL